MENKKWLIDVNAIITKGFIIPDFDESVVFVRDILKEAKVDAVEVVRCKNCKHSIDSPSNPLKRWCNKHATNVQNNDFCSYG